jgi:hypothetical protein
LHKWITDASWNWLYSEGWIDPNSSDGYTLENQFNLDLNNDNAIGAPYTPLTTVGSVVFQKSAGTNRYSVAIGDAIKPISSGGTQIYEDIYAGWKTLSAATINGTNTVLWLNTGSNRLHKWITDANWNWVSSGGLIDPNSNEGYELEAQFGIDTNVDGIIRDYKPGSITVDLITGTIADEFFAPQGVSTSGFDQIITGGGRNQIQIYSSNGGNLYASNGEVDLLVIEGFDASKDQLLVAANKAYDTTTLSLLAGTGACLYEDRDRNGIYNSINDDLLVLLKETSNLPSTVFILG